MRLTSRAGIEGPPVSSLNCDRSLHSGLKAPELVMDGITDGPPPCARDHQAVVLSYSHLARRWVVLERRSAWLVVDTQVKAGSRETHSRRRASKTYGHNAFQIIHIHTTVINSGHCYQQWSRTHYSTPHTLCALTAVTILADAAVTPPSPK